MAGLMYIIALALIAYVLFVAWPMPLYLTGGLLLAATGVFGWVAIMCTPMHTVASSVLYTEKHYSLILMLVLLFVMLILGATIWLAYKGVL